MIRTVTLADAPRICDIYNYYVEHTVITFEEKPVPVEVMQTRIQEISDKYPWLVLEAGGLIVGYAYASAWKPREAYRYSVECSVYLQNGQYGKAYGTRLYVALFEALKQTDIHLLIGGITLPNEASIALHEKFGFEKIGHFREVGFKFDQWLDVAYWEKQLHH